jgi:hypothetical protein
MAVHQIMLADCLDGAKPPARVLTVSVVGDTAFLAVEDYADGGGSTTTKEVAQISVSLPSLRDALDLLADDRSREDLRPLDPPGNDRGEYAATLAGQRYGWVRL